MGEEWREERKRGEGERGCVRKRGERERKERESERARKEWGNERRGEKEWQ